MPLTAVQIKTAKPKEKAYKLADERGLYLLITLMWFFNQTEIDRCVELINNRPMKCLGYKTPNEVYNQNVAKLLKINASEC